MIHCNKFENVYYSTSLKDVPELEECLNEVEQVKGTWDSVYKCKVCGQLWMRFFTYGGQADLPNLKKIDKWPE